MKALIYFEVVTTLALVIGLAAINISKAGVGIQVAAPAAESLPAQKVTWQGTLLHTVPENIAKSVADGQILQVVVSAFCLVSRWRWFAKNAAGRSCSLRRVWLKRCSSSRTS